jgi:dipeptide transport system permease protein
MTDVTLPAAESVSRPISPSREVWLSLKSNKGAMAGLIVIVVLVLAAILADVIAPRSARRSGRKAAIRASSSAPIPSAATCGRA